MPVLALALAFVFASSSKQINQPSNGGGPGPWGPIYIINIIINYKFHDFLHDFELYFKLF